MLNAWFQESSDWKLQHDDGAYFHELIYCFWHSQVAYFLLAIFKQK